jgi:RNA polymerase sigma-70 factor (ECF subfamily)
MILQLCTPTVPHTIAPAREGREHAERRLVRLWALAQMPDAKEADLIERAKTGDRTSFSALVRQHQRRVYACAIHMLGDRGEAEDAVQETFLRAFRAIDRFDGRAELSTWLYRICINVSLNTLRRRKRVDASDIHDPRIPEPAADATQGANDPRSAVQTIQLYGRLSKALDELSPSLRATVVMVLIDGVPQKDAAAALGCSEGTIAWRVHESRRRLREKLGDFLEEAPGKQASERPPAAADGDRRGS